MKILRLASKTIGQVHCEARPIITVQMHYTSADPFAVRLTLSGRDWLISRDLLREALHADLGEQKIGLGDVALIRADRMTLTMTLDSPNGHADIDLPVLDLSLWLQATYEAVPADTEHKHIAWDDFLTDVLTD